MSTTVLFVVFLCRNVGEFGSIFVRTCVLHVRVVTKYPPLFSSVPLGSPNVTERTLIAVKPDGVQRRLVGQIIRRFEQRGFKLVGLKMLQV